MKWNKQVQCSTVGISHDNVEGITVTEMEGSEMTTIKRNIKRQQVNINCR